MSRLAALTYDEAVAVWAALVAQVDDVHAPVWSLTESQHAAAAGLFDRLEAEPDRTALDRALLGALLYPVHDTDHPDLSDDEWIAAEAALAYLEERVSGQS